MSLPSLNLVPLTELDSVNNLLLSIGQSPVNSLNVPGVKDVSIARMTLHNISREVQQRGWWFNMDAEWPLMPDVNGDVLLPSNALQVAPQDTTLTERAGKLYNRDTRSFTFELGKAVPCEIRWFFAFEELPQVARNYIERRAGRVFQTNIVASDLLYRFTKEMEQEAMIEMERNDSHINKPNWFNAPVSTNRIFSRR